MLYYSFFTFALFLANTVATLTTADAGVSSSVSTGNPWGVRTNGRYPDEDRDTIFLFDYRAPGIIQGCNGILSYSLNSEPSNLPGEMIMNKDLYPWRKISDGYRYWKELHPNDDAYIYMVDKAAFSTRSPADTLNTQYMQIEWSNFKGWVHLDKNTLYHGHVIGGYVENEFYHKPYAIVGPKKTLGRCLAKNPRMSEPRPERRLERSLAIKRKPLISKPKTVNKLERNLARKPLISDKP
ncbi:uncharacterized protein PgNI_01385 [Pyricularia grisea]|uniref:Uncharacterized protein n=1 Tax=Pyricularia grisea TaxID=148305 RepID=A0A6P8BLL3_PYRGI|nr:uncharacterized protein PgNI_01385 [Pyricularia grisea]TLD17766.1 hypothetical protein PgNI_01385 [Pyricularia grisea]